MPGSPGQRCRAPSTRGRYLEERGGPAALGEQHKVRTRARLQAQPGAVAAGARPAQREALAQRRHLGQARLSRELERRAHRRVTRGGAGRGRDRPGAVATGSARCDSASPAPERRAAVQRAALRVCEPAAFRVC